MGSWMSSTRHADLGIARPLSELQRMFPHEILGMTIAQQAELADQVCRYHAGDRTFCEQQLKNVRASFPFEPPDNTTGVANMAFMALHAAPVHREELMNVYTAYILFMRRKHGVGEPRSA